MNPSYHKAITNLLEANYLSTNSPYLGLFMDKLLMEHHYACTTAPSELIITAKVEFSKPDQMALEQISPEEFDSKWPVLEGEVGFTFIPNEAEPDVGYFERYIEIDQLKYYRYFDEDINPEERFGIWTRIPSTCLTLSCESQMIKTALDELGEMDKEIYDEPMERY